MAELQPNPRIARHPLTYTCATSAQSATLLTATKQLRGSGSKRTCVVVLSAKAHRPESRAAAASVGPPAGTGLALT